ncbi:bifunctional serine/threonine-protein kinase/ABC transporter substrate-binding protein [Aetokthonos hydrillicola Thurmond2011]|jgi:ABC-type branched-subunit amino acid transport system substrate-binding protein/tRNA A-37 threonylcarbamoyl transferase component Bud32|uniref:non-specific serine/threonine protein kinase n=1 Tax=Aetokthonos hydrillicola Thurmond2011 TaxID=2712845 RepID=A0AAP5MD02_9CYAN|nr:bifunctional serine/threonine-protein kinase/ABC transporter substrate-binding protein [Aetokthonos hydrillicola]MBO3461973.1 ABC transporter substrate-binding protein [Aetokthonos hydrillicola CCALA 1050]MBW4589141.1 ABC transporter substrate-binding protein [Aetokthonos hydrillicola CCALA 1050]MDR9898699.1 bifunctional serine/threonine-protein kinase/ABC transporter substrate-binding protein [Aetokthonos hydrillicola Thurmond2011]
MGPVVGGRYEIIRPLGKGGFGETYLARDQHYLEQTCVVKKLRIPTNNPFNLQTAEHLFAGEAKSLFELGKHPQIPQLLAYFQENKQFYIVQEFIPGHDLSHEIIPGQQLSEAVVKELLQQILEPLVFVHHNNKIHRDIKPANIIRRTQDNKIVLIDFGSVKTISTRISSYQTQPLTVLVGTPGYMPDEQKLGQPRLNSDIYAVGMVGIQALTGVIPYHLRKDSNGEVIWCNRTEVSDGLKAIISKMVRSNPKERYESAAEALEALYALQLQPPPLPINLTLPLQRQSLHNNPTLGLNPTRVKPIRLTIPKSWSKMLVFAGIVSIAALIAITIPTVTSSPTCPFKFEDHLSCGEESLFPQDSTIPEKQLGVNALANKDYKNAAYLLRKAYEKRKNDPETLIYLQNARLAYENAKTDTIAVSVPITNNPLTAEAILRGIAQAQDEVNKGIKVNGRGFRILIADDANNPNQARNIAKSLVSQTDIFGVIGHYASEVTVEALPVYQGNHLVLISPGSTAEEIRDKVTPSDFFFRVVPNTTTSAESLAKYVLNHSPKHPTAAIFYSPDSLYSRSMENNFRTIFERKGGKIVKLEDTEFNLSTVQFISQRAIKTAKEKGATVFVLFPDGQVNPFSFKNTLSLIDANQGHFLIVGGSVLYDTQVLQKGTSVLGGRLVVDVPWHRLTINPNSSFLERARELWGTQEVNGLTAMAYDGALALINALKKLDQPDRTLIQKTLVDLRFIGASGEISFQNGDRQEFTNHLVKVMPSKCSSYKYSFVPVEYSSDRVDSLGCDS